MVTGERGPKGERGGQGIEGERGKTGMSRTVRQSLVWLFIVAVLLAVANLLWTSHTVNANTAAQHQQQLAQQRTGELVETKLCTTFERLAALKPPPGNPTKNPSRAYLQEEHATLAEIGADLGCTHVVNAGGK